MSAKEHYRAAPIVLPDLPPEIWSSIFRLATWFTDIFNLQLMVYAGCDTSYWEQLREFRRSLITKRYLVRVCKAWHCLASPFLFEYIFLGKGKVLAPLRDGMLRSERVVELLEFPHTIGWRTQRLDVHMRDRTDDPGLVMDILADILRRLPNLRILTFAVIGHGYTASNDSYYLPENVLQASSACHDTLRLLNWYGGLRPSSNTWASFLENHPRLEAINMPVALTQLGNSHFVLNSLKSVYVYCFTGPSASYDENELWNTDFPNIHHAIYDITSTTPVSEVGPHYDFLPQIGPKLTSIQINCLKSRPDLSLAFNSAFRRIVVNCKKLARVDIVTCEWQISTAVRFPETVHTLGIRVTAYQIPKRFMDAFFKDMHDLLSSFPSVKTICFMDQGNIRALRAHPQALRSGLARIIILGVNVVDHEGRPLV